MKTFRIENLTQDEVNAIVASLVCTSGAVMETQDGEFIHAHANALSKVLHPVIVDEATSLS